MEFPKGFVKVDKRYYDTFQPRLTLPQWSVLSVILRLTVGQYERHSFDIPQSEFEERTGLERKAIERAVDGLLKMHLINRVINGKDEKGRILASTYSLVPLSVRVHGAFGTMESTERGQKSMVLKAPLIKERVADPFDGRQEAGAYAPAGPMDEDFGSRLDSEIEDSLHRDLAEDYEDIA
jgi:hypothetical protein